MSRSKISQSKISRFKMNRSKAVLRAAAGASAFLLLLAVPYMAGARELRIHNANSGCADGVLESSAAPTSGSSSVRRSPTRDAAGEAPIMRGASQDDATRPRWHSILPGMFR